MAMFDSLKSLAGLAGVMKDLPRMKRRMEEVKRQLVDRRVIGESGGGAVRVTADGTLRVHRIEIDPAIAASLASAHADSSRAMIERLLIEAVNGALDQSRATAERELTAVAEELGIPLPAGALSGLVS
jgi:hypothetical protein